MRYAIVSDLHANLQAWNAALLDIRSIGVDGIICLGDIVGYGPDPAPVLESAYTNIDHFVLGNHDAVVCGKMSADLFNDEARDVILWTREQVGANAVKFLNTLPLSLDGGSFRCTHGEFSRPAAFDYIFEPEEALPSWQTLDSRLLFVGHTHLPGIFLLGQSGTPHVVPPQDFELETHKRYLVNVGSIGQPRDGDARACYCVHDTEANTVLWRRIPFDIDAYRTSMANHELDSSTTYFLQHDPREGASAVRESMNFSPPRAEQDYAQRTVEVQSLETLQRSVSRWKLFTILGLSVGLGLAALTAGLWLRHQHRGVVYAGLMPSALSTVSAPLDQNVVMMPAQPSEPGKPVDGWLVRLGDKRQQTVTVRTLNDGSAFNITSSNPDDAIEIASPPIRVRPDMGITISGLFKKSENFRGNVSLALSLTKDTGDGVVIVRDFMVKEPNMKRKADWWAAQVTETMPADATAVTLRVEAACTGAVMVKDLRVSRSR